MKTHCFLAATLVVAAPFCHADEREIERETARELYELALEVGDKYTNASAANTLARLGATEAAHVVDRRSARLSNTEIPPLHDAIFTRKIAVGKLDEARQLWPNSNDKRVRFQTLSRLAQAEIARGNKVQARADLMRLATLARGQLAADPDFALLLAKAGDLPAARRVFARAQAQIEARPRYHNAPWARQKLVLAMFRANLKDEAIEISSKAPSQMNLSRVEDFLTNKRDWQSLEKLGLRHPTLGERQLLFLWAATVAHLQGEKETAQRLAIRAENLWRSSMNSPAKKEKREIPHSERWGAAISALLDNVGLEARSQKLLAEFPETHKADEKLQMQLLFLAVLLTPRAVQSLNLEFEQSEMQTVQSSRALLAQLQKLWEQHGNNPKLAQSFEFAAGLVTQSLLAFGDKENARPAIKIWEKALQPEQDAAGGGISREIQTIHFAAALRDLGGERRASEVVRKKLKIKTSNYSYVVFHAAIRNGFVREARAVLPVTHPTAHFEGLAAKRFKISPDYVDYSAALPKKDRLRALISYGEALAPTSPAAKEFVRLETPRV